MYAMRRYSTVSKQFKEAMERLPKSDPQAAFDRLHQKTIGLTTIPAGASKSVKEIAQAEPWKGEESVHDANLRMLVDKHKPLKPSRVERLHGARENALDYKYNEAEGETFRERLKKPRTHSSGLSGGGIESIAMQQIEDAIARGQFKDLPRGKPLEQDYRLANPYIDNTEYILNKIIKKQGALPPWISKQQDMHTRIEQFRKLATSRLVERLVHKYTEAYPKHNASKLIEHVSGKNHQDKAWETQYNEYHILAIDELNRVIRSYNLQAPQSARKGYLFLETELEEIYSRVDEKLPREIHRFMGIAPAPMKKDLIYESLPPLESPDKHYGLKQMFLDLINRRVTLK